MYTNEPFSLPKMRGGRFFALWGLLEAVLVNQKMDSSVPSVTCDHCDLSSN